MAKVSQQKNSSNETAGSSAARGNIAPTITKTKRTRKTVPRDSPPQRSSIFRGVTRHRWTGRYEAHLWDKNCWNESQNKKGRQVYLGAYDDEEAAARAYDLAALKYWGQDTILNFPLSNYREELKEMDSQSKEEYIGSLRRKSSGFSRGVSKYRGVARHHHNGRWEARIGRVFGNKYLYLGTYATQEEAATAYDMAAIEYRGLNAVTNFDLSRYIKWLRPNPTKPEPGSEPNPINPDPNPNPNPTPDIGFGFLYHQKQTGEPAAGHTRVGPSNGVATSALGLLLQSSKFKEMLERTSVEDFSTTASPESNNASSESDGRPGCSFPDDIQTYFECQDNGNGDDIFFGDLNSFAGPIFAEELDE